MAIGIEIQNAHHNLKSKVFGAAMSNDARELVNTIVGTINAKGIKGGGRNPILEQFAHDYQPAIYEDAVIGWQWRELKAKVESILKKVRLDDLLTVAQLRPLYDKTWEVPMVANAAFRFSRSASHTAIYAFLTSEWLLDDFSRTDLIKLVELAREFPSETIKDTCKKLSAPEQRHIAYLYKVLKNEGRIAEVRNQQTTKLMQDSQEILKNLLALQTGPRIKVQRDTSWIEDAKISRIMEHTDDVD